MAVDTRNKRAACIGFPLIAMRIYPNPSGSLGDQASRQHIAYAYPGILAGSDEPEAPVLAHNIHRRVRRRGR